MKHDEYTTINPRYLLWMLTAGRTRIPEGSQTDYMLWIQHKIKEFDLLLDVFDDEKHSDGKDFDEWLIYTVINTLTA